jgi:hypothetical protein
MVRMRRRFLQPPADSVMSPHPGTGDCRTRREVGETPADDEHRRNRRMCPTATRDDTMGALRAHPFGARDQYATDDDLPEAVCDLARTYSLIPRSARNLLDVQDGRAVDCAEAGNARAALSGFE